MKITVCITSFNQKSYLVEAIESVLSQTLLPSQLIIVDDCSSDGSQELISDYYRKHIGIIKPIYNTVNKGVTCSRNIALKEVDGDFVCFLDGDDRFLPLKLEEESKVLRQYQDVNVVYSNYYYIDSEGERFGQWSIEQLPPVGNVFIQTATRSFPRNNLFRNELVNYAMWKKIGFYDTTLNVFEDWEMRIRLSKELVVSYVDKPLVEYRKCSTGISNCNSMRHCDAFEYIYSKSITLLDGMKECDKKYIIKKLKFLVSYKSIRASNEILNGQVEVQNKKKLALLYYLKSIRYNVRIPLFTEWVLLLRIVLPTVVFQAFKHILKN